MAALDTNLPLWTFLWGAGSRWLPVSDASALPKVAEHRVESLAELWRLLDEAREEGGLFSQFARRALWFLIDGGLLETWLGVALGEAALAEATAEIRLHGGAVKAARWLGRCCLSRAAKIEVPASARDQAAWRRIVESLSAALAREVDPRRRGELAAALAALCEEHLGDAATALTLEKQVFAGDPFNAEAAEHLERIGRGLGREREVAEFFRAVATQSLPPETSSFPAAAPAPVAPSAAASAEATLRAVGDERALLRKDPRRVESYRALRRIYARAGNLDAVWCLCSALECLGGANSEERAFLLRYPALLPEAPTMIPATWPLQLLHSAAPRSYGELLRLVWQPIALRWAEAPESFGLDLREQRDLRNDPAQFAVVLRRSLLAIGAKLGALYLRPHKAEGLHLYNCQVDGALWPSLVVGRDLLAESSVAIQTFAAAKRATLLRPDCYLRFALPADAVRAVLLAAVKLARPDEAGRLGEAEMDGGAIAEYVELLGATLNRDWQERVAEAVEPLLASGAALDVERWIAGIDLTADRVGLALSSDLGGALRAIALAPQVPGAVLAAERRRELILYAVSDQYFAARQQFGAAIG